MFIKWVIKCVVQSFSSVSSYIQEQFGFLIYGKLISKIELKAKKQIQCYKEKLLQRKHYKMNDIINDITEIHKLQELPYKQQKCSETEASTHKKQLNEIIIRTLAKIHFANKVGSSNLFSDVLRTNGLSIRKLHTMRQHTKKVLREKVTQLFKIFQNDLQSDEESKKTAKRVIKHNCEIFKSLVAEQHQVMNCSEAADCFIRHIWKEQDQAKNSNDTAQVFIKRIEKVEYKHHDHIIIVLNRAPGSDLKDMSTWGDAIIVDPYLMVFFENIKAYETEMPFLLQELYVNYEKVNGLCLDKGYMDPDDENKYYKCVSKRNVHNIDSFKNLEIATEGNRLIYYEVNTEKDKFPSLEEQMWYQSSNLHNASKQNIKSNDIHNKDRLLPEYHNNPMIHTANMPQSTFISDKNSSSNTNAFENNVVTPDPVYGQKQIVSKI